jgi:hypothetical protein
MLGCQDFCGYYDWSFHYVRRTWGQAAVEALWQKAIGEDSQRHYRDPAVANGLRALYNVWTNTGRDEHCDWTFTLDEQRNFLRWDMRECPSKGFLIKNDLNADEDYCNHCMGWIIPMLESIGAEIVEHEHNHCGQCWATMRMKNRPSDLIQLDVDIRNDPRWQPGYLDRWSHSQPLPLQPEKSPASDSCELLEFWFRGLNAALQTFLVSDENYNDRQRCPTEPRGVLIGTPPADLTATASRYNSSKESERPLLMHAFLPGVPFVDFLAAGLPRPVPILPLLIRKGKYVHRPGNPLPTAEGFLQLLAAALKNDVNAIDE